MYMKMKILDDYLNALTLQIGPQVGIKEARLSRQLELLILFYQEKNGRNGNLEGYFVKY